MKRILITGGAGFIGSHLALRLAADGYTVRVLDSLSPQVHGKNAWRNSPLYTSIRDRVEFVEGTVTSKKDWLKALDGQEIVVHLAAETGTGQSMYAIDHYTTTNIGGTALLTDILTNEAHSVRKVVVASSRSIYGEGKYLSKELGYVYPAHRLDGDLKQGMFEVRYPGTSGLELVATDEGSKVHPSSVYGITKQVQEQLIMTVCPNLGIVPVAFRYQNVYGPGQSLTNPYTGILSIFSTQIKKGNGLNIFEDGQESRDFVYVDDAVEATVLGIERAEADGEIFNVGSGVATPVIAVAQALLGLYGREVPVRVTGNYRLGDIRHNYADLTKIGSKLGFAPKISFQDGMRRFAGWVDAQDLPDDMFEGCIREVKGKGLFR